MQMREDAFSHVCVIFAGNSVANLLKALDCVALSL